VTTVPEWHPIPARIAGISTYLPEQLLDNDALASVFENWSADKIFQKTGIAERRIARSDETALDMGVAAAERLLSQVGIDRQSIDYLIFCTQAPDYILPTSACIMQNRLNLPKSVGAFDINLGCSGYVYGLSIAAGLIAGKIAKRILFVTADTYSKFIHDEDRSVRTLFGDGASATLIESAGEGSAASIGPFVFGTDGAGAEELIVRTGGARNARSAQTATAEEDEFGNVRSQDNLYMNGAAVMSFTLREVPRLFSELKERGGVSNEEIDFVVMHQANKFLLDALVKKMKIPSEKAPYFFEKIGNTVSSTIPFVLEDLVFRKQIMSGSNVVLMGFGVGLSWGGMIIKF